MNKLLEKAYKVPKKTLAGRQEIPVTRDECEMFMEMLKGNITVRQYATALGFEGKPGSISHRSLTTLRKGMENGWLTLRFNSPKINQG